MSAVPGLRPIRERQRLSQAELATLADMPASSLSHFEAGSRAPSLPNLVRLAAALGCSTDELLGRQKPDHVVAERNAMRGRLRMIQRLADYPGGGQGMGQSS